MYECDADVVKDEPAAPTMREFFLYCCGCCSGADAALDTREVHITQEVHSFRPPDDERVSISEDRFAGVVTGGTGAVVGGAVGAEGDALKGRASAALAKARAAEQRASRASQADKSAIELVSVDTRGGERASRGASAHGSAGTSWYDRA